MNFESLQDCIGAYGGSKERVAEGLISCLGPWQFIVLVAVLMVAFVMVAVILSLLVARRDRARREDAKLSDEELARRTREMQRKWNRRLFGG